MTTPTDDSGKSADDRSMAERVIDKVTGRDHDREIDERAAAAARQDAEDRANLADDDDVRASDLSRDDRVGAGVDSDVDGDADRTSVFRPTTPVSAAPSEPVGGEVTGDDVPASAADRARPAWPGPSAASSVGQAATPGPEKEPADRDRAAWAGPTVAGSRSDVGSSGSTDSDEYPGRSGSGVGSGRDAGSDVYVGGTPEPVSSVGSGRNSDSDSYPGRTAASDPYPGGDTVGSDAGVSSGRDASSGVDSDSDEYPGRTAGSGVYAVGTDEPVSGVGSSRSVGSDVYAGGGTAESGSAVSSSRNVDSDVYGDGTAEPVSGVGSGRNLGSDSDSDVDPGRTGAVSGVGAGRNAESDEYQGADTDGPETGSGLGLGRSAGSDEYSGVGSSGDADSDTDSDSDQASRAIPTGSPVTAPATSSIPVTSGAETTSTPPTTSTISSTSEAPVNSGTSTTSDDTSISGVPATPAAVRTSDDGVYRPGDPSVREDYAHADADRRATGALFDDEDTKNEEDVRDGVDTKDRVGTREGADGADSSDSGRGVDGADVTTPAPVTSITGGRRRSEAAPDAVHGVTEVTPDSEWRDLQAKFVDDPEATVNEAATLIERDLAGLRSKLAGGDTEHLRNAFKRYRSLHESLR